MTEKLFVRGFIVQFDGNPKKIAFFGVAEVRHTKKNESSLDRALNFARSCFPSGRVSEAAILKEFSDGSRRLVQVLQAERK